MNRIPPPPAPDRVVSFGGIPVEQLTREELINALGQLNAMLTAAHRSHERSLAIWQRSINARKSWPSTRSTSGFLTRLFRR